MKRGESPRILFLYGELGSGKTTFVQGFAKGLGLVRTRLLSPTFIIVRRYQMPDADQFFHHIDLYRMNNGHDLTELGLDEIFGDQENFVAVEWPERLGGTKIGMHSELRFAVLQDGKHEVNIRG